MAGFGRDRGVTSILMLCFLLSSAAYVAQQNDNTAPEALIFRRLGSRPSLVKRAEKSHVLLTTEFSYTTLGTEDFDVITSVSFGESFSQVLKLSVTPQHVTWVPQEPGSIVDFCNESQNPENAQGCRAAGRSGYYRPIGGTGTSEFSFEESYTDVSNNQTATGYWAEDTITADGIAVNLQFGVALQWHSSPILGLGIQPVNQNPRRPGYLDALFQQGKIAGRFCSFYNHMTENVTGEIVLGGVDAEKLQGNFSVWRQMRIPGEVDAPAVRISNGADSYDNPGRPFAVVDPLARALFIPNNTYQELRNILELDEFGLKTSREKRVGLPCERRYPPEKVLELTFNETVIRIQFNDLKGISLKENPELCELLVVPTETVLNITKQWSFVLGGPFFRAAYTVLSLDENGAGIGALNPTPTGRKIIELGGNLGASLDNIRGGTSSESSSSTQGANGKTISTGAIAGIVIAGVIVLATAAGTGLFFWRRREGPEMPDLPSPEGYPQELSPDVRLTSELQAKSPVPSRHELPSHLPQELEGDANR